MTIVQDSEVGASGGGVLVAPTPTLPDGRGAAGNIIPVTAIPPGRDLVLRIATTTWVTPNDNDTYEVQVTRTQPSTPPVDSDFLPRLPIVRFGPVAARPAEIDITVPAGYLGENATPATPTPIWVRLKLRERGLNALTSPTVQFFVDRTAPYQAKPSQTGTLPGTQPGVKGTPAVTFPNAPVGTRLDDAWASIPANAAGLRVVPGVAYANPQPDDRLTLYADGTRTDPPAVPPIFDAAMPVGGEVVIPMSTIRSVTTGRLQVWFRITDVAGNFSNYSVNFRDVLFLPLPILAPPIVLLASTPADNVIDLDDVRSPQGIQVRVNRPTNSLNTDGISLAWGDEAAEDLLFGTANFLLFTIPWSKLSSEYLDKQSGTNWVVPVTVTADLMRGGSSISTSDVTVDTDYSVPGNPYPIDPVNPPPDVNPELKPLIVRGQAPVIDNQLGPQDINQTARVVIDLTPVTPGTWPDPEPGDQVTVHYFGDGGDVVVGSAALTVGNINTTIEILLSWNIVDAGGQGLKQMWWVVENPNRTNSQKAAETTVTVNTVALDLPVPELVRDPLDVGTPDGFIICNTLIAPNRVARFRIPPSVDLPTDTEVTFTWRGWRDAAKTIPAPANTEFTATRRITAAETVSGMLFDVGPYDPVIRNVPLPPPATPDPAVDYFGYVEVQYTIPLGGSLPEDFTIYLLNADFLYCESEPGWIP
ncbi:hypothetical protein [Pseudomonas frederiksbergensis]|uniref:hypothetical protein n=2 Tax=Pseudomonas TaxID=286 RepID=UPI003D1CA2C0